MPITDIFPHELRATVPPLHSQEGIPDPMVHVKFFTGEWIWYVTEGSPDDDADFMFFGFVKGNCEEWGEFSLSELRACADFGRLIERDVDFKPDRFSQIISCGRQAFYETERDCRLPP